MFEWYLRLNRVDANFQAGDYDGLRVNSSMGDVVDVLKAGPVPPKPVSFLVREGLWESETRQLVLTYVGQHCRLIEAVPVPERLKTDAIIVWGDCR